MKARLSVLALCALCPGAAAANDPFEILGALPDDPQAGTRLEAALVYRDMRLYQRSIEKQRATLVQTKPGAAFFAAGAQEEAFGFDPFAELVRILDLAHPDGGAVPAGVAAFTGPTGTGVQLLMKVQPGFLERLGGALASPSPPPWPGKVGGDTLEIAVDDVAFVGRVDGDGWFRLAPDEVMLVGGQGRDPFAGTMRTWTEDLDALLLVQGGGMATSMLAAELGSPFLSNMILSMRSAVFGWAFDGDRTWVSRLLIDIPQLEEIGSVARSPQLNNTLARVWDEDTSGFLSLSLPPALTGAAVPLVERELAGSNLALPEALVTGISGLDGRLGFVTFDSPGDWAAGIGFRDAATARVVVPALQQWLTSLGRELDADLSDNYVLEQMPPVGNVMHMRPDAGLEGWRAAAIDNAVVMTRKSRLTALFARAQSRAAPEPDVAQVAGPVTAPIRSALDAPAMILGYAILTGQGGLFEYLAWSTSSLKQIWNRLRDDAPELAIVRKLLDRVPTYLALEGITWSMMYDAALWADLRDSVAIIQLLHSEI